MRIFSDEHKLKLRLAKLGKKQTRESVEKRALAITGSRNYRWKGGRSIRTDGYVLVKAYGHPRANPSHYVLEHVSVMEKHIGRHLQKGECVHHANGDKTDNRIENLVLMSGRDHRRHHFSKLTHEDDLKLREMYDTGLYTQGQLGAMFGVKEYVVSRHISSARLRIDKK